MIQNKNQNNLLFYCLEKKSLNIFDFVQREKPNFLTEKNTDGFNCFTVLVNKISLKNIEYFLEKTTEKNKEALFSSFDNNNNNLFMQMIKRGNSFYQSYKVHFEKYDKLHSYSHTNAEGQTIPHLMAFHDTSYAIEVLDMPQFKMLGQKNNKGVTPLLLAARHSSFELFKKIAEKSNINEKTDLFSNAIHFASYDGNVEKLYYLLEKGLNPNEKNLYNNTALSTSLVEKKFDFSLELLKVVNEIEFEDALYIVRASEKNSLMFSYLMSNKTLLLNTLKDEEKVSKFLTHVFYYASASLINKNENFFTSLIKKDSNLLNSLFLSSIAGRRDFLFKANHLIKNYGWLHLEPHVFTNFKKEYPSGFLYALNQLPKNQMEYLVNNAPIIENLNDKELILFKMICVNKNSTIFNKVKKLLDFSLVKDDKSILELINKISVDKIINNLNFFEEMFVNKAITDFVTDKIAQYVFDSETPVEQFKDVFRQIKNIKLKKEIYIKLNELLLSDNKSSNLELIFKNKYTIMENVLNSMLIENPNRFQNLKYLIDNPAITLKGTSAWSYLRANKFSRKSFFVIAKSPELLNHIKEIKLSDEIYISSDFLKIVMQVSNKNEKSELFMSFLEYSFSHDNISPNTYNYFFTNFTEKEQKHIVKTAFHNYLETSGTDNATYQFLERKYLAYYNLDSLNKNILNLGNIDHIHKRLHTDNSYINIFNSSLSKKFNFIDIINLELFKKSVDSFKNKMAGFDEHCLKDFMTSKIKDIHLMGLATIINESKSQDISLYSTVVDKLESFLSQNPATGEFFQQTIENLLFNKNPEIKNLILKNEKLANSDYLSEGQKKYIFSQLLNEKIQEKKEIRKAIKI